MPLQKAPSHHFLWFLKSSGHTLNKNGQGGKEKKKNQAFGELTGALPLKAPHDMVSWRCFSYLFCWVPLSLWSVSKLSSVTESEKEMPVSFPDSCIPTVTKIIIDINSGNKLLDHRLGASSRAGKASKITQYHDCILKGKYIKSHSQLTKRLFTHTN